MCIKNGDLIEIAVESHRAPVAGRVTADPPKMQAEEVGHHFLLRCPCADDGRLGGHDYDTIRIPRDPFQPDLIRENPVGNEQTMQIFRWQSTCQSGAAGRGDHGESVATGIGGFEEQRSTRINTVLLPAMDEFAELGQRVTPATSFFGPYFEVPFLTALENSSLA